MKEKISIKAKLKQEVTESEFLIATFNSENFDIGLYNIDIMKTTELFGSISEGGSLYVNIPKKYNNGFIEYGYENEEIKIWDYEFIK